jgi:hypothetical protein
LKYLYEPTVGPRDARWECQPNGGVRTTVAVAGDVVVAVLVGVVGGGEVDKVEVSEKLYKTSGCIGLCILARIFVMLH